MKRNKVEWKEEQREKGEDEKQSCNLGFNFVFMIFYFFILINNDMSNGLYR